MPTGYTAGVGDGEVTELREFVMECSRAFGALVELRDSPSAAIPDEFKPSSYYAERLAATIRELETVRGWTLQRAEAAATAAYEKATKRREEWRREKAEKRDRYEAMVAKVEAWEPPTSEHVGLKNFMLQQLHQSIEFDCGGSWEPEVERLDGRSFKKREIERLEKERAYDEKEYAADVDRARQRTEWITSLRSSLELTA